jgi:uncharacterized membrane protein YccC
MWMGRMLCSSDTGVIVEHSAAMARRPSNPKELPDAVRDAVERTMSATAGSAERSRDRAQVVLDGVVGRVRGAADAIDDRMPATHEDIKELKAELRAVARRLDAIEERLPKPRKKPAASTRKRSTTK